MNSAGAPFRALFGRIGIALVVCVALVAGGFVYVNSVIDEKVDSIPKVQLATTSTENNGTNFLIIGSDSRAFVDNEIDQQALGTEADNGPPRSDTMMVLHANGDKSYVVSFPRDTWVNVPGLGDQKINAAFNNGPQSVVDTIQNNFQVPINHYLEVDFETFAGLVDAVGGVPVYFANPTRDLWTGLGEGNPFGQWGCQVLGGGQALAYVRSRHPEEYLDGRWKDVSGLADLDRIGRQQAFIRTLGRVAMDVALDDPTIAPDLADALLPNLTADDRFDREAFNQLARALLGLSGADGGIEFTTLPTDQGRRASQDVLLVNQVSADPVLERLRGNVVVEPTTTTAAPASGGSTAAAVTPSQVRVKVLNGSGVTGAAGNAQQAFTNAGFVPGGTANDARGSVARTEVRHRSADLAKAQLVASYVAGADLVVDESVGTDVVVVIGKDFTEVAKVTAPSGGTEDTTPAVAPISPEQACTGNA